MISAAMSPRVHERRGEAVKAPRETNTFGGVASSANFASKRSKKPSGRAGVSRKASTAQSSLFLCSSVIPTALDLSPAQGGFGSLTQ